MELYAIKYGENFAYATYKGVYKGMNNTELVPGLKRYVITGDECYMCDNISKNKLTINKDESIGRGCNGINNKLELKKRRKINENS